MGGAGGGGGEGRRSAVDGRRRFFDCCVVFGFHALKRTWSGRKMPPKVAPFLYSFFKYLLLLKQCLSYYEA